MTRRSVVWFALSCAILFRCGLVLFAQINRPLRPRHHALDHRHESVERYGVVIGIEGVLVVARAEHRRALEIGMTLELIAHVPVETQIVEEIIALENSVVL